MTPRGNPRSLADLGAPNPKVEEKKEPHAEEPKPKPSKPKKTPKSPTDDDSEYVDGIYIFNSENDLSKAERSFYLKRRRKYLEEYSLNDSADMGLIHRIIMEEILGERIYTEMLANPGNAVLGQQLSESNKRYQTALDTLGASRDKRLRNRESGGVSVADLAKTYFDERKSAFTADKEKHAIEDAAVEDEQKKFFELQFGAIAEAGAWSEEDGFTDDEE